MEIRDGLRGPEKTLSHLVEELLAPIPDVKGNYITERRDYGHYIIQVHVTRHKGAEISRLKKIYIKEWDSCLDKEALKERAVRTLCDSILEQIKEETK